jgi:hypothetical protein
MTQGGIMDCFNESGRLTVPPEKEFREVHGKDEVAIAVYHIADGFLYSINCRLGTLVRSSYPHPDTPASATMYGARKDACLELSRWIKRNRDAKKHIEPFSILEYRQLELPFDFG